MLHIGACLCVFSFGLPEPRLGAYWLRPFFINLNGNNKLKKFNFLFVLFLSIIPCSVFSQSWVLQNSGVNFALQDIYFLNDNIGFACGANFNSQYEAVIIKTTNGGNTWISKFAPGNYILSNIKFFNDNTGIAVSTFGNIFRTTNQGENWNAITPPVTEYFNKVNIVSSTVGYITGHNFTVLKTVNSGSSWQVQSHGILNSLTDSYFINATTGFVTSTSNPGMGLLKSTNEGVNWSYQNTQKQFESVYFVNQTTGFASGVYGVVYKTSNGGNSWSLKDSIGNNTDLYSIHFANENTGYIVGGKYDNALILKTTNGGESWQDTINLSMPSITGVHCARYVYLAGSNGAIYRSANPIGIVNISSEVPSSIQLEQNFPNPFNPVTNIKFTVPQNSNVKLFVCDLRGKIVSVLVNEHLQVGMYQTDFKGDHLASGIYFYTLEISNTKQTKKMLLLK